MTKPTLPQGTRDFSAEIVRKRNYILSIIKHVFELYGFQPLETPAMENLETLMGKYGEEGDKLIFRILNNGVNDPRNIEKSKAAFENVLKGKNDRNLTERALRYDLTIPFARYVAMNHGQLTFPFRRYQMQPVWRADRPQKGRYREFYQCDADVVGSSSLINEVEFALIYHQVFNELGIKGYRLHINSRKILAALADACGGASMMNSITVAIDKLDKIGLEKVKEELSTRGLDNKQIEKIEKYLAIGGTNKEKINELNALLSHPEAQAGTKELEFILDHVSKLRPAAALHIDFTLARGLNYYTGAILEAKAPAEINIGSIGGGGRYDDLTGLFGVPGVAGVGISFGVDRIYDVMEELNSFPGSLNISTRVLFINNGEPSSETALTLMNTLRENGISCELYHENSKIDKQYKYAEKKSIPIVATVITEENNVRLKNIISGEQKIVPFDALVGHINFEN